MQEDDKLWPVPDRIGRQVGCEEFLKFVLYSYLFSVMMFVDVFVGTRDSDGGSAHFIHNLQNRKSAGLQKLEVSHIPGPFSAFSVAR